MVASTEVTHITIPTTGCRVFSLSLLIGPISAKWESELCDEEFDGDIDTSSNDDYSDNDDVDDDFLDCCSKADQWEIDSLKTYRQNYQRKTASTKPHKKQPTSDAYGERRYPQIVSETKVLGREVEYPVLARRVENKRKPRSTRNYQTVTNTETELERAIQASLRTNTPQTLLGCGLTAAQIQELTNRELTPEDYELLLVLDSQIKPKTVETTVLDSFTHRKYSCEVQEQIGEVCTICFGDYEEAEDISIIPVCNHGFHSECIRKWLGESSTKCPLDGLSIV
jgi:hypothetical protein